MIMAGLKNGFGVYLCSMNSIFVDMYDDPEEDTTTYTDGIALMLPFCQIAIQWERR
jgi:hypothetical protein